jgi:hypothetical protein
MFEYRIEFIDGRNTGWIQWDTIRIALSEAKLLCEQAGEDKIKEISFRRKN